METTALESVHQLAIGNENGLSGGSSILGHGRRLKHNRGRGDASTGAGAGVCGGVRAVGCIGWDGTGAPLGNDLNVRRRNRKRFGGVS